MPSKNLAIQNALNGDWQNATSINKALLNDNPNDVEALNRLAFAFTFLGKIKNAKSIYKKVLKLDAFNPIAIRNLKRLTDTENYGRGAKNLPTTHVYNTFLEETGKTKIIELVNTTQPRVIASLQVGQPLTISIKRSKIFIQDMETQYIGVLPDDIGKRIIKLIKGGNQYETFVRSANSHRVVIFMKEIKRVKRFKNQPSFLQTSNKSPILEKEKSKTKVHLISDEEES